MKKVLKVLGIIGLVIVGVGVVAVIGIFVVSESMLDTKYVTPSQTMVIPTDADSIKEGGRLAGVRGCTGCHTLDLGGDPTFFVQGPLATIGAANITSGGKAKGYTDADWVRTLRHGVNPEGRALAIMPAGEFFTLSDADLSRIIAFVKSAPAVRREIAQPAWGPLGRMLIATGQIPLAALYPAASIPHNQAPPPMPPAGATVDYGRYMATTCKGCHNPNYSGGPGPGTLPNTPIPANLTASGPLSKYSEAQFLEYFRTGTAADGHGVVEKYVPVRSLGAALNDTEKKTMFAYFNTLPARETGK